MQKLVLASILAATVVLPLLAAREPDARIALRKVGIWMVAAVAVYTLLVLLVYPRLVG